MSNLDLIPEVNFVEKDLNTILSSMIAEYEQAQFEQTGEKITLTPGSPMRIFLYSQALRIYTAYQLIDYSAKMNLLKYSEGGFLDNIGARYGSKGKRLDAGAAITTQRFHLSAPRVSVTPIPIGTRVGPGNDLFFETIEYREVAPGNTNVDAPVKCLQTGAIGNGYSPGQINVLVDPIPYVASTENIEVTIGGSDVEENDNYKERLYQLPESFSVAGPDGAYEYFAKEYSPSVIDVSVTSPSPGVVDVRFILEDGEIPNSAVIQEMQDNLSLKNKRPLTDNVTAGAPTQVDYDIDITYFIGKNNEAFVSMIQQKVNDAVEGFVLWQKSKIGRDINQSELIARIIQAGAKRVTVNSPTYTALTVTQVGNNANMNINYGGVEDE